MANKHINIQHATSLSENACPGQPAIICHEILGVTPSSHQLQVANATVGLDDLPACERKMGIEGRDDGTPPDLPTLECKLNCDSSGGATTNNTIVHKYSSRKWVTVTRFQFQPLLDCCKRPARRWAAPRGTAYRYLGPGAWLLAREGGRLDIEKSKT